MSLENKGDVLDEDTKTNTTTSEEGVGNVDLIGDPTGDSKESELPDEMPTLNESDKSNDVDLPDAEMNEETKTDNEPGLSNKDIDNSSSDMSSGQLVNPVGSDSNSPNSQFGSRVWNFLLFKKMVQNFRYSLDITQP